MTQEQLIIVLLKIGLIAGLISLIAWVGVYSRLAKWWRSPIGRTIVIETLLIALLFVPQILSLFLNLTRLDSRVAAWADVALIAAVTPVMLWRAAIWLRLGRTGRLPRSGHDGLGGGRDRSSAQSAFHAQVCS
jgi:hypothetical protein